MNKFVKIAGASVLSLAATTMTLNTVAHASPYGQAGCGLGSIIFKDKPGFKQVLAATSNGLGFNQLFAISSGTSNCSSSEASEDAAEAFIQSNREALAKDISRGNGETIANLSALAGCDNVSQVGGVLQSQFSSIFPNAQVTDQQVSGAVISTLKAHAELSCDQLI